MSTTTNSTPPGEELAAAAASARPLPLSVYRDPDLFDAEIETIFRREWLLVGLSRWLDRPGSYYAIDVLGEALVIVRQADHSLRAMSRLCKHRGMPLVEEGRGELDRLSCTYHLWTYRLDGSLIGAPFMNESPDFDKDECSLPAVRVEEWMGFVFVNLDPMAPALAPRITGVADGLTNWRLEESVDVATCDETWQINWKLGVENSSESYHHPGFHADSVGPSAPPSGTWVEPGTEQWTLHRTTLVGDNGEGGLARVLPLTDDDRAALRCYTIFPSTVILVSGAVCNWLSYLPLGPTETRLLAGLTYPSVVGGRDDLDQMRAETQIGFEVVNSEDRSGLEQLQRVVRSRLAELGPLSAREGAIHYFHRYLARTLT
jgi:phenylpropionate dioxygenase-like ring-hydroxylating dioxygenase large terminal subunit